MTTQYNVIPYGSLTNTSGVLSNFSVNNYATLPLEFNPTLLHYDIVFKFNTVDISKEQALFVVHNANNYTFPVLTIEIYNNALYFETTSGEVQYFEIIGSTTLSSNTDYWVKLNRNGNTYTLYLSTDGITFTSEGTYTSSSHPPLDNYTSLIGLYYNSVDEFKFPLDGSIDLNGSYININNIRWWQGVTSTSNVQTRIQLRHDTAANWASVNPVLLEGEVGIETDTLKQKVGDGSTAWNSLAYAVNMSAKQDTLVSGTNIKTINNTSLLGSGNIDTSEIFVATYGTTTYSEITTALSNYKTVICNDSGRLYYYIRSTGGYTFGSTFGINSDYVFVNSSNVWSRGSVSLANINLSNVSSIDSGSAVATALNGKADTDLSNLSSTGKTVIDGQWVSANISIGTSDTSLNGSTELLYTLSDVPNDGHEYEVVISVWGTTGSTNGNGIEVQVRSDKLTDWINVCRATTRTSSTATCSGNIILPLTTSRKIYVRRGTGWNGTFTAQLKGYRRIGSNT